jgi:DMSO/TMAO reductase YedYZ heme-binding membrane subunit
VDPQLWWYTARAGGIVALALTAGSVIWGLLLSTRVLQGRPSGAWLLDLHRFLGGTAVVFTGIHLAGLVADTYVHFGVADLLVPFASAWKTGAVAWGIVAFYLLLAVELSSLVMNRIPRLWWKRIHLTAYVLFWTGVLHGATAGTDAGNPVYVGTMVSLIVLVAGLTLYRILTARKFRGVFTSPVPTTF